MRPFRRRVVHDFHFTLGFLFVFITVEDLFLRANDSKPTVVRQNSCSVTLLAWEVRVELQSVSGGASPLTKNSVDPSPLLNRKFTILQAPFVLVRYDNNHSYANVCLSEDNGIDNSRTVLYSL